MTEYLFIEKILHDTTVLRKDELTILKDHLLSNTSDTSKIPAALDDTYPSSGHDKALLKMHGDLELTIRNRKYIRLVYYDDEKQEQNCEMAPCSIKYQSGHLYLVGYVEKESETTKIRLDKVHSFEILREQRGAERKKVDSYTADDAAKN